MELDFDDAVTWGLRGYVRRVTAELGLTGECSYVQSEQPATAYLALDGRLPGFPDRDVALLWDEEHGDSNHQELWLRFAEGIGVDREEVLGARRSEATRSLVQTYVDAASEAPVAAGVAAAVGVDILAAVDPGGDRQRRQRHSAFLKGVGAAGSPSAVRRSNSSAA